MPPLAECIHRTAGRFRLRVDSGKGNAPLLANLQEQLARCPQVSSASANPMTGTVLVLHDGEMRDVVQYAQKHAILKLAPGRKSPLAVARATIEGYRTVNKEVRKWSGGELDLPHAAFIALLGTGVLQVARGRMAIPPWHTAFWYAMNLFVQAHGKGKQ